MDGRSVFPESRDWKQVKPSVKRCALHAAAEDADHLAVEVAFLESLQAAPRLAPQVEAAFTSIAMRRPIV